MKKNEFPLVGLQSEERQESHQESFLVRNHLRSLRSATRHIANLIKLGRYGEAEEVSRKFSGIIKVWDIEQKAREDAAMKRSNPVIAKFPSKALEAVR